MLEFIISNFDKVHFLVYESLIKISGHRSETQFENVYLLASLQFFSCIIMSSFIVGPFFLLFLFVYFLIQKKKKKLGRKMENVENDENLNNFPPEKLVNITEEKIMNRFETQKIIKKEKEGICDKEKKKTI